MRKFSTICLMSLLAVFLVAGSAMAVPFDSLGWVNPNFNDTWDSDTLTGTAQYSFYITEPTAIFATGHGVNKLSLAFENDIFDVSELTEGSFEVIAPPNWGVEVSSLGNNVWSISTAGTLVTTLNDPLILQVEYTLLSVDRFSFGSGSDWAWNESQGTGPWAQAYTLDTTDGDSIDGSGGSTAPIPEPATMLLLGSGLIGLAGVGRKKYLKK